MEDLTVDIFFSKQYSECFYEMTSNSPYLQFSVVPKCEAFPSTKYILTFCYLRGASGAPVFFNSYYLRFHNYAARSLGKLCNFIAMSGCCHNKLWSLSSGCLLGCECIVTIRLNLGSCSFQQNVAQCLSSFPRRRRRRIRAKPAQACSLHARIQYSIN